MPSPHSSDLLLPEDAVEDVPARDRCRLLELPTEILDMIYTDLLHCDDYVNLGYPVRANTAKNSSIPYTRLFKSLVHTCRRINTEATAVFFRINSFTIKDTSVEYLSTLPISGIRQIRHHNLGIYTYNKGSIFPVSALLNYNPLHEFRELQQIDVTCGNHHRVLMTIYSLLSEARCVSTFPKVEVVLESRNEPKRINGHNKFDTPSWVRQRARFPCASARQHYLPSVPLIRFKAIVGTEIIEYMEDVSVEFDGWNKKKAIQRTCGSGDEAPGKTVVSYTLTRSSPWEWSETRDLC